MTYSLIFTINGVAETMDVPKGVPSQDKVISMAHSFNTELDDYGEMCAIIAEDKDLSDTFKALLLDRTNQVNPILILLTGCWESKLAEKPVADLMKALHKLEIWLNKILSQLRQHKQDASWMYEMTEKMSLSEAHFSTTMSYYQMYWHHGVKPLGTTNPYLVTM